MNNQESILENWTHKILWYFEIQTDYLFSASRPDVVKFNKKKQKKQTYRIADFAVPADQRVKLEEGQKRDKYLDLARELKNLCKMKMTVIPIVIGALGTFTIGLIKEPKDLEIGGEKTIQTTALLRSLV